MRKFGLVAAAMLALLGTAAHAKTTIVYAGRVITDAGKAAQGPSTITITDSPLFCEIWRTTAPVPIA